MRFEPRHAFAEARIVPVRRAAPALPIELAFLEGFGIARLILAEAVAKSLVDGVDCIRALVAGGMVSEARYHLCLAKHLDVPFVETWPRLTTPFDPRGALRRGWVGLGPGQGSRWLIAPGVARVRVLLVARDRGLAIPNVAIATPSHFAAILRHRARVEIADVASLALPAVAPLLSARTVPTPLEIAVIATCLIGLVLGVALGSHLESDVFGLVFLAGIAFRLLVCADGLSAPPELATALPDRLLPTYSVLVPLRDEAGMVPGLVAALAALDYPPGKREILFLVEADDPSTRAALAGLRLPAGFTIVDVPAGTPRTKPRALNAGLMLARGELVTVYDAEDRPEPDQLRRAAARFEQAPDTIACLQARLAIANAQTGLLSMLFAIDYATLFDVFNPGLTRRRLPLALGGTSNHFRASTLRAVGGWDAWNVTEDADLGLRLARFGFGVDMLDSTTWEEAPERLGGWFKQRRRWTKGWAQTLLVLARDLPQVLRDLGPRQAIVVALLLTNLVTGPLLTPVFLALVARHLVVEGLPTPRGPFALAEATLAGSVIALGALGTLWTGWHGARRRGLAIAALPALLVYQSMICGAAWGGLVDLVRRPHHWHKTQHGAAGRRKGRHLPFVLSNVWMPFRLCGHQKGASDESDQDHYRHPRPRPVLRLGLRAERWRQGHGFGWHRRPGQPKHRQQRWRLGPLRLF